MTYAAYIVGAVLATAALSLGHTRQLAMRLGFASIYSAYAILSPPAASLGHWWFLLCMSGEVFIIIVCVISRSPCSKFIGYVSAGLMALHVAAMIEYPTPYSFVYGLYPYFVRAAEMSQVAGMLILSPPIARIAAAFIHHYDEHKGLPPWMRRFLILSP